MSVLNVSRLGRLTIQTQALHTVPHSQPQGMPAVNVEYVSNCFMQDPIVKTTHNNSVNKPASQMAVRQTPYYHNCKLLSPDGTLLAIVDRKKLDWYSQRALGGEIKIFLFIIFSIN